MITSDISELFVRDSEVPLYSPNGLDITKKGMCNAPRAVEIKGRNRILHDYPRAIGLDNKSRIMHAINGNLLPDPVLEPGTDSGIPDRLGCEDAHVLKRTNPQTGSLELLMSYVGYDGQDEKGFAKNYIIIATSNDFYNFNKKGPVDTDGIPDKDCPLLLYKGKLYLLRRPMDKDTDNWPIVVSELDLETLSVENLGEIKPEQEWERLRIGAGFAFGLGDFVIVGYHGVSEENHDLIYRMGIMVLDGKVLNEESHVKVLYRTSKPVLVPRTKEEVNGFKDSCQSEGIDKRVIFPASEDIYGDNLRVLYGAGDRFTRTASCRIGKLLKEVIKQTMRRVA
jgi:predicted GH43/DUF377 family glycosyl hydrolase